MGYAQHTYGSGGENIYLWPIEQFEEDRVLLPSPMVTNCIWIGTEAPGADFIHTGVQLTFQRRRQDIEPAAVYRARLEGRVQALEAALAEVGQFAQLQEKLNSLTQRVEEAELDIRLIKERVLAGN
jgi:hypothetical protein